MDCLANDARISIGEIEENMLNDFVRKCDKIGFTDRASGSSHPLQEHTKALLRPSFVTDRISESGNIVAFLHPSISLFVYSVRLYILYDEPTDL